MICLLTLVRASYPSGILVTLLCPALCCLAIQTEFVLTSIHQVHVSVQGQNQVESIVHAHHSQASSAATEDTDRGVSPKIEAGMDITYQQRFSSAHSITHIVQEMT